MARNAGSEDAGTKNDSRSARHKLKVEPCGCAAAPAPDVADRSQVERELIEAREYAESIVEAVHEPLIVLTPELVVKSVNSAFYEHFKVNRDDTLGHKIYDLGNGQWDIPALRKLLEEVLPAKQVFNDYEVSHNFEGIGHRVMLLNARQLDHVRLVLLGIRDITESKQAEEALRENASLMQADFDAVTRLHELAMLSVREGELEPILTEIVDAAIAISGAAFGNIQLLDPTSGDLTIVAQRGFPPRWLDFWNKVRKGHGACGTALDRGERVIIEDVERSPVFAGTPALEFQRRAGVRAVQSTPLISRSGKPLGMFSTHYKTPHRPDNRTLRLLDMLGRQAADLIEAAQAEQSRRTGEAKLEAALASMTDAVFISDAEGRFIDFNEAFATFHRFGSKDECLKTLAEYPDILDVFFPDGTPAPLDMWAVPRALRGETVTNAEYLLRRKDTGETWVGSYSFAPIRDKDGVIVGSVVAGRDITDRKQAEEALRRSNEQLQEQTEELQAHTEELRMQTESLAVANEALGKSQRQLRSLMEANPLGVLLADTHGRVLEANEAYLRIIGRTREELRTGQISWDLITPPEHLARDIEAVGEAQTTGVSAIYEKEYLRPDGERISVLMAFATVGGEGQLAGFVLDITERKRAEQALRESERGERERAAELATFLDAVPMPIFIAHDSDCLHITGNRVADDLLRNPSGAESSLTAPAQVRPRHFRAVKDGRDLRDDELPAQRAARGTPVRDFEFSLVFADGAVRHVVGYGTPLFDELGQPRGAVHVLVDITDRKVAEETLRRSQERLALAASGTRIGMYEWHVATGEAVWTEQVARLLGLRSTTTTTTTTTTISQRYHYHDWAERVHPEDLPRVESELRRCMTEQAPYEIEYRTVWPDGSVHWLLTRGVFQHDADSRPMRLLGIVMDISERKRAERDICQTNEALQLRTRQLQQVMLELTQTEERERKRLAEILHDDLQQQLAAANFHLGLLRGRVKGNASMVDVVNQIIGLLGEAIAISRRLSRELSPTALYHGDFTEVLEWLASQIQTKHGLIVHVETYGAVEVLSDGVKTMLFRTAQEILFNAVKYAAIQEATVRLQRRHNWLWMGICDKGRGFDPKILKQAAGFGLTSIRERVELLGGRMRIRSAPGRGSTFLIALPDSDAS